MAAGRAQDGGLTETKVPAMRHRKSGRTLGRTSDHRRAMFRNMAASLIEHERITTTVPKAKELRRVVEPLITLAGQDGVARRRMAFHRLRNKKAVGKPREWLLASLPRGGAGITSGAVLLPARSHLAKACCASLRCAQRPMLALPPTLPQARGGERAHAGKIPRGPHAPRSRPRGTLIPIGNAAAISGVVFWDWTGFVSAITGR